MKSYVSFAFVLTIAAPHLARADEPKPVPVPPEKLKWAAELLDEAANGKVDPKAPDLGGIFPSLDEVDPGAQCKHADGTTLFSKSTPRTEFLGMPFSFGVTGNVQLLSDSTKMGAEATLGTTLQFGNLSLTKEDGGVLRPLEVRFDVVNRVTGTSSLDVGLYAFGYRLGSETIASTGSPIDVVDAVGWTLPVDLSDHWGGTFDCDGSGACQGSWDVGYSVVATASAIYGFHISYTGGVQAGVLAGAQAYAEASASAMWHGLGLAHITRFDLVHGTFSARGRLVPFNGRWLADAEGWVDVEHTLKGEISFAIESLDLKETIWSLPGLDYSNLWTYQCTLDKPF